MTIVVFALLSVALGSSSLFAAMDDVIVWNSARTQVQIENTLVNGYSGTTGMTMWWAFNNSGNLIYDTVSAGTNGVIKGAPVSLSTTTPNDTSNLAASGFTSTANWLAADIPQNSFSSWTCEMWVRNPQLNGSAVFWSLTSDENGGGDADIRRMWVNADGSLTMGDRGYYTWINNYSSAPLTWDANKWYQITIVQTYIHWTNNNIKVYRGAEGDTSVSLLLDYSSSQQANDDYWIAVGAHPAGYYSGSVGMGGYLGPDTTPVPEPGAFLALASGLIGLGGFAVRRRRS